MLQVSKLNDPLVAILRLAYRRGLVILQEQEEARKAASAPALEVDAGKAVMRIQHSEIPAIEKVKGRE